MIIQVLGSNGAGKSTLVRRVLLDYDATPVTTVGRRRPLYYTCVHKSDSDAPDVAVIGHYEIANGGCDTIRRWSDVVSVIDAQADDRHVLFEGPTGREHAVRARDDQRVVWLQRDVRSCVADIAARGHRVSAERVRLSQRRCARIAQEYECRGVTVAKFEDRDAATEFVRQLLRRTL